MGRINAAGINRTQILWRVNCIQSKAVHLISSQLCAVEHTVWITSQRIGKANVTANLAELCHRAGELIDGYHQTRFGHAI